MTKSKHWNIYIDNTSDTRTFINSVLESETSTALKYLKNLQGAVLSKSKIDALIQEEELHDLKIVTRNISQSLKSMSSGEQRKLVLEYLLGTKPDFLILDNPFDNLDLKSKENLTKILEKNASKISFILLISRKSDALSFIENHGSLTCEGKLIQHFKVIANVGKKVFIHQIPKPLIDDYYEHSVLIEFKYVHVSFNDVPILRNIHWTISKGEFWQLKGANGSGKTTLLSMITGENNKGYGQELYLFGNKKGKGETIWNIKKHLGYYSPTLTHNFKGHHSIEQMLISGLTDSIGLYQLPTEQQIYLADQWLSVLNMKSSKNILFSDLTVGHQRLVMVARAMIKQPLVLLLDEPTENLDDESAMLFVSLINKIAKESTTSILYVSHRKEEALEPQFIYELQKTDLGSVGLAVKI